MQSCCSSSQSAAQLRSRLEVQNLILEHTTAEHCTSLVTGKAQTGAGCRTKALRTTLPLAEADPTWHGQVWGRAQPAPSAGGRPGCQGRGGCGHRCQQRHAEPARSHRRCPTAHRPMNRGHPWCTQDVVWCCCIPACPLSDRLQWVSRPGSGRWCPAPWKTRRIVIRDPSLNPRWHCIGKRARL